MKIDAESRLAVSTQVTVLCVVPRSSWITGRTGAISDWIRIQINAV